MKNIVEYLDDFWFEYQVLHGSRKTWSDEQRKQAHLAARAAHDEFIALKKATEIRLLANLRTYSAKLDDLLKKATEEWTYEDGFYRYYHHSFKAYRLQTVTEEIVLMLESLLPECPMNWMFVSIILDGTGKEWDVSHNPRWEVHVRPIIEAFSHAKFFLEMAIKYKNNEPSQILDTGYAALLYLYNLR